MALRPKDGFDKFFNEATPTILEHVGDDVTIGSETVRGAFSKRYREIGLPDGTLVGLNISFDCMMSSVVTGLAEGDVVTYDNVDYLFIRRVPAGGDETGLVTLELGTP